MIFFSRLGTGGGGGGGGGKFKFNVNQNENENKNASGGNLRGGREAPPRRLLHRSRFCFLFNLRLIYIPPSPSLSPGSKNNQKKTKCVSNDSSGHDDQFYPKIVKIRAILGGKRPFKVSSKSTKKSIKPEPPLV